MTYDNWPSHIYNAVYRRAASLLRGAVPANVTPALRPYGVYNPREPRRYGGVRAADLVEAAKDQEGLERGCLRPGVAVRMAAYTQKFIRALGAYRMVKRALGLWRAPLMEGYEPKPANVASSDRHPIMRRYIWRKPPPSAAQWKAREARYGFDIRATSPTHIKRRVYRERARLRAALTGPLARGAVAPPPKPSGDAALQGPPVPRDYKEAEDMFMVWPPVFLDTPKIEGSRTAQGQARHITEIAECPQASSGAVDRPPLQTQYLWALIMYGHPGVANFIAGLPEAERARIEEFERHLCRAPPFL